MLKRGHDGTFHKMSAKHLDRYVSKFAGRHNIRGANTEEQKAHRAKQGRRLKDLAA